MKFLELGRSGNALLLIFIINSIVDLFVYTFFTAHMLSLTDNNIAFISQFYILEYLMLGVMFFVLVPVAKKIKHINMLRIGAVAKGLFLLLVILLGADIVHHYIWLAMLYGTFEAIFWSGGNTLKTLVVDNDKVKSLISMISINARLVGIICPVIFGISIDAASFGKIAIIVLGFVVVQCVTTIFVKQIKTIEHKSQFREYFKLLKTNQRAKYIKYSHLTMFFRGLQYFVPTFITYMIIYVLKTNTSLGILTTVASIVAILILIAFNTIKKLDTNIWLYIIFTILESVSLALCIIFMQPVYIIIFQVIYTATKSTIDAMSEALRGTTVRDANMDGYMTESMAIGELCLNSGRMMGFGALFILGIANSLALSIVMGSVFILFLIAYNITTGILKKKVVPKEEIPKKL